MIEPRLASSIQVSAFLRLAAAEGDFAAVLRKGDAVAGAILIVGCVRGRDPLVFERFPSIDGESSWQAITGQGLVTEPEITDYWQRRTTRDPDLWVIELDVATLERLSWLVGTQA